MRQVTRWEHDKLKRDGVRVGEPEQEINPETGLPTGHFVESRMAVRTTAPKIEKREWTNKRTGEVEQVPVGIDPGWDYNPGKAGRSETARHQLKKKLAALENRS